MSLDWQTQLEINKILVSLNILDVLVLPQVYFEKAKLS